MKPIRDALRERTLLFDGAMGTCFAARTHTDGQGVELACLHAPQEIAAIHRAYLGAGCRAIKTNTFAANLPALGGDEALCDRVQDAAWRLAAEAAGDRAYVFADLGPLPGLEEDAAAAEYLRLIRRFLALGAKHFLFETCASSAGLVPAVTALRQALPEAYLIVSFAAQPDGFTQEGHYYQTLFQQMADTGAVDAVGLNCVCGAHHMRELARAGAPAGLALSVMPNAGYPTVRGSRAYYDSDLDYFARELAGTARAGAAIVGGCCGTTPETMRRVALVLEGQPAPSPAPAAPVPRRRAAAASSAFLEKLRAGERVLAVELDPPKDASADAFLDGARRLQAAGIDVLTIADCPVARARMDSSLLACKVTRELGLDVLPHMTCRDRNLNAAKALTLGLYAEGVRQMLVVTGDPIPSAQRDEVKSVYQFNSRKLAAFLDALASQELPGPMAVFGALNVNARNFDMELARARQKREAGMVGFLTQPVLTEQALENLRRARETLDGVLLGGIIPVVSARNAQYMDSEINGIRVDPRIARLHEGKTREQSEEIALQVSFAAAEAMAPLVDGYYLMTPFQRVALMERLIRRLRVLPVGG